MRVIVTGGAGFIGSQWCLALEKAGHSVVPVDNLSYGHLSNLFESPALLDALQVLDIRDERFFSLVTDADTVFHFAGIAPLPVCQSEPCLAYDINVSGTANVLEACRRAGVGKIVFASTSAVYENNTGILKESDPVRPDLVYALTKKACEDLCAGFAANYGLNIIVLRFFNVYGPHQDFRRLSPPFTSYIVKCVLEGTAPNLFNNNPEARRDYVHTQDLNRLFFAVLETKRQHAGEVYNVASGQGYSVPEIFSVLREVSESTLEPEFQDPKQYWDKYENLHTPPFPLNAARIEKEVYKTAIGDPSKTEAAFDWRAETSMREGLQSVWDYQRACMNSTTS